MELCKLEKLKKKTLKKLLIFWETELSVLKIKKLIFQEGTLKSNA